MNHDAQIRTGPLAVIGWAAYLACSWTWCIGMFLPVLLIRDFGIWGYIVFAVPNVIGAAAMGWVLARPGSSRAMVEQHLHACRVFSGVTIAFQCFFLGFVYARFGSSTVWLLLPMLIVGVLLSATRVCMARRLMVSILVFFLSALIFGVLTDLRALGVDVAFDHPEHATRAMMFAPICVFGFLLCPYLDLTFHHARQQTTPRTGNLAFALGFGVLFASMIVFTLLYAQQLLSPQVILNPASPIMLLLGSHLVAQLVFTTGVHAQESTRDLPWRSGKWIVFVASAGLGAGVLAAFGPRIQGLTAFEYLYRSFLVFYGLVFPAYVWLVMVPSPRTEPGPTQRHLRVLAIAVVLALPFYFVGWMRDQTVWLPVGLLVVLVARLFLPRRRGEEGEQVLARGESEMIAGAG